MESLTEALRETLAAFDESAGTPLTTTEVADRLDLGRRSTYDRLERLADRGRVETKAVGASARVWWRPADAARTGRTTTGEASDFGASAGSSEQSADASYLASIFENQRDLIYVFGADATLRRWNDPVVEVTGYANEELEGMSPTMFVADDAQAETLDAVVRALDGESVTVDLPLETAAGERIPYEFSATPIRDANGTVTGFTGIGRDVTDRQEKERELERRRAEAERELDDVFERVDEAVLGVDASWRIQYANDDAEALLGTSVASALGSRLDDLVPEFEARVPRESLREAVSTGEHAEFEFHADALDAWVEVRAYPSSSDDGLSLYLRDVTDRVERERQLRERVRQQEAVATLGQRALRGQDVDALLGDAVELVADVLDTDYCKVLDLDAEDESLLLRQGVGWRDGLVGSASVSAVDEESQAAYTLESENPVVVEDLTAETRFSGPSLLTDHDVRGGISTVIGPADDPWGVLGTHDTSVTAFSEHDVTFVQSVAHILASAIARRRDEDRLRRQREQLTALLNVTEVVQGVTDAVVEQSTRREIETAVCEHLAAADSYLFAWIGDVDPATQTVTSRAEAGVSDYLDGITISVDPSDEHSDGPTGRAFRTGEVQTTQDIVTDESYQLWRSDVAEYGFRSSAAIPLTHDDATYGVLNVYAARPNAFEHQERAVISRLGDVVGHAIAATERKRALLSDEAVELEFHIDDLYETAGVAAPPSGEIRFDHAVPVSDDEFVVYGAVDEAALPAARDLAAAVPQWEAVSAGESTADGTRPLEVRARDPPLLSALLAVGGGIDHAVVDANGEFDVTVHVPFNADVRRVTDAIQDAYPTTEMIRRRQVAWEDIQPAVTIESLPVELTERQRNALQAAYYAGYFERPRAATGGDVADSLGISQPTFSQHLRDAERKVLDALLANVGL